jgi:mitogen-activated protein kinase kinase kinase 9
MEYAKGGTLRRLLEFRKTGLPPLTLIQWALQVAYGMQFLHEEAGITIIHRDLKSSNILLSDEVADHNLDDITLKLSDFGLARETQKNGGNIMTIAGTYR